MSGLTSGLASGPTSGGTRLPVLRDAHVHLGLIDPSGLCVHGIGAVVDLGWAPSIVDLAREAPVEVDFAGGFLAPTGGYPSDRDWAPPGSVIEVDRTSAAEAVEAQVRLGAAVIKVSLNSAAGPVLDVDTVLVITAAASRAGVPVVAHVEGEGTFETALAGGVDVLAHTPWTARLTDRQVQEAAGRQRWISTLDIHGYGRPTAAQAVAVENAARFHAAGGRILYGTDLGNGPLPVGLNLRELQLLRDAGLDDDALLAALVTPLVSRPTALTAQATGRLETFVPGDRDPDLITWLARARAVPVGLA